jgi:hypothetical protein
MLFFHSALFWTAEWIWRPSVQAHPMLWNAEVSSSVTTFAVDFKKVLKELDAVTLELHFLKVVLEDLSRDTLGADVSPLPINLKKQILEK